MAPPSVDVEGMRFLAVLNSDGGTLRTTDLSAFSDRLTETMAKAGHEIVIKIVSGSAVVETLEQAAAARNVDVVIAGGGDGTVSAAAACLMGKSKALAVLPAGTMNLFARGLGIPPSLDKAVAAFADGEIRAVDMATANGQPFVHQFSVGMHAKLVHLRSKMEFGSRWGKIRASAKAAYSTVMNPPSMRVKLELGGTELLTRTTGIGITNNLFGEGTLPFASDPAGGKLGVYITVAHQRQELVRFFAKMARGKWQDNEQVEIHQADEVSLQIVSQRFRKKSVVDGELVPLQRRTLLKIHPRSLNVLVPKASREGAKEHGSNAIANASS